MNYQVLKILKDVAHEVILPRFNNLKDGDIREKSHAHDLVTVADEEAEQLLSEKLLDLLPGSVVVGEEAVAKNESIIEALQDDSNKVWVIDPIDGTSNFANGRKYFGTLLALVQGGQTTHGWLYNILDEEVYVAIKGEGVSLYKDGSKVKDVHIAGTAELDAPKIAHYFQYSRFEGHNEYLKKFEAVGIDPKGVGASLHDYLRMVNGKISGSVHLGSSPWDHLAGMLMIEEAGGVTYNFLENREFRASDVAGAVAARNQDVLDFIVKALRR